MLWKQKPMKQISLKNNNQGVTLIEVIAVVAVLGVVMAAVTGFMITGTKMSAQVSGTATSSMKDETAVEFINRRILGTTEKVFTQEEDKIVDINTEPGEEPRFKSLYLGEKILITSNTDTNPNAVVYCYENEGSRKEVVICPGEIYFQLEHNTVTYVLNDVRHVVHLRVASGS